MSKTLHISGVVAIASLVAMRVIPYFEGVTFDKFWSVPIVVFPVGLMAFLTFFVSSIVCGIAVARKKISPKNLIVIGLFLVLVIILYQVPLPSYVDGMHKTVIETVSQQELTAFAVDARSSNLEWSKRKEHDQLIQQLKAKHPKPLSLSPIAPRIDVSENYISVFYGSALVKHWGYVIGDLKEFPIEHIPESMYKKVYDGVWVYHDIW
jgi:hypothetical protein